MRETAKGSTDREDRGRQRRKRESATGQPETRRVTPGKQPELGQIRAPLDDVEREIWSDTFSAKGLVNYWLAVVAGSVLLPVVALVIGAGAGALKPVLVVVAAAWVAMFGWLVYLKLDAYYILTNQRFLHKRGILTRHTRRIEVIDIDDISFRQGIIERLLNVGTIEVLSSDRSDPVFQIEGIDNVHEVAHAIDQARRAERVRRGLHIETV